MTHTFHARILTFLNNNLNTTYDSIHVCHCTYCKIKLLVVCEHIPLLLFCMSTTADSVVVFVLHHVSSDISNWPRPHQPYVHTGQCTKGHYGTWLADSHLQCKTSDGLAQAHLSLGLTSPTVFRIHHSSLLLHENDWAETTREIKAQLPDSELSTMEQLTTVITQ